MKNISKIVVTGSLLACATAQAGGLYLYETNTTDISLASAGMAARAKDASVMVANPAGLSNVSGKSFSGNLISLYGDTKLDTMSGDAGNVIGYVPMGSVFYSQSLNEKWTLGMGVYGNYGLGLGYDGLVENNSAKLDIPTAITQAITIQPTASYRINDQWSIGAGLGVQYGMFELEANANANANANAGKLHGAIETEDTDLQLNGHFGVLYELVPDTRFGLAYTSETKFEFEKSDSVAPQQVIFSIYQQVNDKFAWMSNVNWQDWSEYQTTFTADTQDTYQVAFGTQYQIDSKLTWNAGFAYDSSMYEDQSHGDITVPTGDSYRISTGFEYKCDEKHSMSLAFEAVMIDSSEVPSLNAGFENPSLYFLSFGYNWKN
ncbi:OmpP1/FadL family transporter [Vibrio natriegens]|uniref:OmpP1/FadL family transporter n=1 Tax=Vibrio natriegens TaxID=691 RepID=UPI00355669E4